MRKKIIIMIIIIYVINHMTITNNIVRYVHYISYNIYLVIWVLRKLDQCGSEQQQITMSLYFKDDEKAKYEKLHKPYVKKITDHFKNYDECYEWYTEFEGLSIYCC